MPLLFPNVSMQNCNFTWSSLVALLMRKGKSDTSESVTLSCWAKMNSVYTHF